mgnify:FL=1
MPFGRGLFGLHVTCTGANLQLHPATWLPLWVGHVAGQVVSPCKACMHVLGALCGKLASLELVHGC